MRIIRAAAIMLLALTPAAAIPALNVGVAAPDFTTTGALAGERFNMHLREQLRNGPLVLYPYPRPFTEGSTPEAHAFSEPAIEFLRMGARVTGMSADDHDTLRRFRVEVQRLSGGDGKPGDDRRL